MICRLRTSFASVTSLLGYVRASKPEVIAAINTEKKLTDEIKADLNEIFTSFKQSFATTA